MSTVESPAADDHAGGRRATERDDAHGPDFVHTYDFGVSEGNARVPRWLLAVILALFGFFVYYVSTQWDAQPSSARAR